jgi:hypothetical protein
MLRNLVGRLVGRLTIDEPEAAPVAAVAEIGAILPGVARVMLSPLTVSTVLVSADAEDSAGVSPNLAVDQSPNLLESLIYGRLTLRKTLCPAVVSGTRKLLSAKTRTAVAACVKGAGITAPRMTLAMTVRTVPTLNIPILLQRRNIFMRCGLIAKLPWSLRPAPQKEIPSVTSLAKGRTLDYPGLEKPVATLPRMKLGNYVLLAPLLSGRSLSMVERSPVSGILARVILLSLPV